MNSNSVYLVIATIVQTGLLIWGLKMISYVLKSKPTTGGPTFAVQMLSEKSQLTPPPAGGMATPPPASVGTATQPPGSFSRISGAIGAIVLAAFFAGVSYWALFTLFNNGDLKKLADLGTFFLVGSALFAPYAFNQIKGIFQP